MRASSTKTIVEALRILARDIQSEDGVANAAIYEAADRLDYFQEYIYYLESQIKIFLTTSQSCKHDKFFKHIDFNLNIFILLSEKPRLVF